MPAIAVNRDGVVGVSWYDRRDFPDESGWIVRFRASLDGGETWLPSIRVSEQPNNYSERSTFPLGLYVQSASDAQSYTIISLGAYGNIILGGDTAGLAADVDGVFHPVWADNRTGVAQVWTAPVTVRAVAVKNGAAELAVLDDISKQVSLDLNLVQQSYDRQSDTITIIARMRNTSESVLHGPIKARVVGLYSDLAIPRVIDADNGAKGTGAVWDFTATLRDGELAPGETSKPRQLVFGLSDIRPFRQGHDYAYGKSTQFRWGLINLDVRVLGTLASR